MENMRDLNMNEMGRVYGGATKTIRAESAVVRAGAGLQYGVVGSLSSGAIVNFTGNVIYNDMDGYSWLQINSPVNGWVTKNDINC